MGKNIKNKHVLIVGSGYTLKQYWDKINLFIKENEIITIGCNNVNHILTPDYHFWTDRRRYAKYGKHINKKSTLVFGNHFNEKMIKKYCKGYYEIIKYTKQKWKKSYEDPMSSKYGHGNTRYSKKTNTFYGVYRSVGSLVILWTFIKKAKKISIVGMDGYTLFSKEDLNSKTASQHCYGNGHTDNIANSHGVKNPEKKSKFYKFCEKKDEDIYKTLKSIKKYGVKFEIITPTVYKKFYNKNILENINIWEKT